MCIMFSKTCVAGLFLIKFCKMRKTFCILKLKQLMLEAEVFDLKLHENWDNIYDKTIHYQFSYNIKKHTGKSYFQSFISANSTPTDTTDLRSKILKSSKRQNLNLSHSSVILNPCRVCINILCCTMSQFHSSNINIVSYKYYNKNKHVSCNIFVLKYFYKFSSHASLFNIHSV